MPNGSIAHPLLKTKFNSLDNNFKQFYGMIIYSLWFIVQIHPQPLMSQYHLFHHCIVKSIGFILIGFHNK